MSTDETRARRLAEYDHNHTPDGHFIQLTGLQDATTPGCPDCGLTATVPSAHKIDCPAYLPHPDSIAAQ